MVRASLFRMFAPLNPYLFYFDLNIAALFSFITVWVHVFFSQGNASVTTYGLDALWMMLGKLPLKKYL